MINESAARLDDITAWSPEGSCASLHMLRLDLLHPVVSGNKWFKLKYNAAAAMAAGKSALLTFGGGYSNHLVAAAFAARELGLESIGLVRGNYSGAQMTPSLQACLEYGMKLVPLSKAEYATVSLEALAKEYPEAIIIPEGGANEEGLRGAEEIARFIPEGTSDVCVAIGTGTTLRGLLAGLPRAVLVHGFYVAKNLERMGQLAKEESLSIYQVRDARFGKWTAEGLAFMRKFYQETGVPLDVVYTSKMMMKVEDLLKARQFVGRRLVCVHTGGLQGNPVGLYSGV